MVNDCLRLFFVALVAPGQGLMRLLESSNHLTKKENYFHV